MPKKCKKPTADEFEWETYISENFGLQVAQIKCE